MKSPGFLREISLFPARLAEHRELDTFAPRGLPDPHRGTDDLVGSTATLTLTPATQLLVVDLADVWTSNGTNYAIGEQIEA